MAITRLLARRLANYDNPRSMGSRFRAKRVAPLLEMIEDVFNQHGRVDIVDIGGTERYWGIIPRQFFDEHNVKITLVNLPGSTRSRDHGPFRFVEADACALTCFSDKSFHIAHSNSVVEHVGDWQRMTQFASELSRIATKYFVQTPNYWFPVEPHCMTPFFHWLPEPTRVRLVTHFRLGHWRRAASTDEAVRMVESARLLSKNMLQELFQDGDIVTERFFGLPKSHIAIKH